MTAAPGWLASTAAIVLGELMNKNALRFLIASALLSPATLYALGLGEIRLNSALNQPFDADIEVVSASTDELSSLKVALANEDMFRRYGLDRPNFLSNISMRVDAGNAGRPVIKLRSQNAVTEPFVSLLVEVTWTGGRVLREYTVLLDPPVFAPASSQQQVVTPRGRSEEPATTTSGSIERNEPAAAPARPLPPPATSPTPARPATATITGDTYKVRPADTLSKVATAINQDSSVSHRQAMVALYRANPQAFDGNMNVLRAGSVLRIPAATEMAAISNTEASAELSRQTGAWKAATSAAAKSGQPNEQRLRLVPPKQGGETGSATASAAANDSKVRDLQAQLAEARRLLDLKNAELAQMQKRLSASTAKSSTPAEVEVPRASSSSSIAAVPTPAPEPTPAPVQAPPPVEQAAPPPAPEPAPVAKPTPQPAPVEEPSLFSRLAEYSLWIILAGLALIAGLIAYFRRRQSLLDEQSSATLTAGDFNGMLSRTSVRTRPLEEEDMADTDEHEALDMRAARATAFPAAEPVAQLSEDTLSSETAIHVDQQDALAEADFHMAYGLYDQAADIVKLAIERQPERRDLRLKLAEIYFVWGNKDSFLDTARQIHDTQHDAPAGEWDKVLIMGKQICPEDPLFSGDIAGSRLAEGVDVNLEGGEHRVDIDLYDAPEGDQPKSDLDFELASTGEHKGATDSGLDFLLDEPQRGVNDDPTREMDGRDTDGNARTQETPTIESPYLHAGDDGGTIREKFDPQAFTHGDRNIEQTAELSLDEIGLDVSELETTGTVGEDSTQIGDDDMTRLATAMDRNFDPAGETKTMVAPHIDQDYDAADEDSSGNTITVEQIDLEGASTMEQARPPIDASGVFKATQKIDLDLDRFDMSRGGDTVEHVLPEISETGIFKATQRIDMDLDYLADPSGGDQGDTVQREDHGRGDVEAFSEDVFGLSDDDAQTAVSHQHEELQDTNISELNAADLASGEFQMPEMEPVTMSEVGTKLDLARAYMDMGDPDGARSILQEVLDEGNSNQKQEAQRLLDSIG